MDLPQHTQKKPMFQSLWAGALCEGVRVGKIAFFTYFRTVFTGEEVQRIGFGCHWKRPSPLFCGGRDLGKSCMGRMSDYIPELCGHGKHMLPQYGQHLNLCMQFMPLLYLAICEVFIAPLSPRACCCIFEPPYTVYHQGA